MFDRSKERKTTSNVVLVQAYYMYIHSTEVYGTVLAKVLKVIQKHKMEKLGGFVIMQLRGCMRSKKYPILTISV